ncbi:MAG: hypothetical protein AB1742_00985 [bacterium]
MKKIKVAAFCITAGIVLIGAVSFADVPLLMSYQGRVTDLNGVPIADGSYDMTFGLFTTDTLGVAVWTETQLGVAVENGLFSVNLGASAPLVITDFNQSLWLEVTIGVTTYSPRHRVVSAGYALGIPDNAVTAAKIKDGEIANADISAAAAIADTKLAQITTAGKVSESALTGTNWTDLTDGGLTALHQHSGSTLTGIVHIDPSSADASTVATSTIWINKTALSGNLVHMQVNGADEFVVGYDGTIDTASVDAASMVDGAALAEIADDDGAGSGLDADLLDGYDWGTVPNATDIWVNETGDTMTGDLNMGTDGAGKKIYFAAQDGVNEGGEFTLNGSALNADWNIDNYVGRVRMHTGGTSYFDLDTAKLSLTGGAIINQMGTTWGGWNESIRFPNISHAAITYPQGGLLFGLHSNRNFYWADTTNGWYSMYLEPAGNLWVRNYVAAPIYYDSNNTGYYLDPASLFVFGGGDGTMRFENTFSMQAKNNLGTYETFLWPRWSDNNTYMNFGGGGNFYLRNNSSTIRFHLTDNVAEFASFDFKIGHESRRGSTGRALVDLTNDLRLNYGPDWKWASVGSTLIVKGGLSIPSFQTVIGPGTGADNQTHTVTCSAGYAIVVLTIYSTDYLDGNITLKCDYLGPNILNTADNLWEDATLETCDGCWHYAQCSAGRVATGIRVYASSRLDTNLQLYCTALTTGSTRMGNWMATASNDQQDDDVYQGIICPAGSYLSNLAIYAATYLDSMEVFACTAPDN